LKKFILLLLSSSFLVFTAEAQLGYNYNQYGLGFGVGYNAPKTDVPYAVHGPAVNISASYNLTPYTRFSVEYEFGKLEAGYNKYYADAIKNLTATDAATLAVIPKVYQATVDPYRRAYVNTYQSIVLHGDVQFGEFIDYSNGGLISGLIKNIYVGTGVGTVYNHAKPDTITSYKITTYGNNILVPVRAGYQFKFYNAYDEPSITAEIGYQMNYVFGFGLDGYTDSRLTTRNFERYGGWHIGLKFNFGDITSYRKAIH
jgi:hypothetical protein